MSLAYHRGPNRGQNKRRPLRTTYVEDIKNDTVCAANRSAYGELVTTRDGVREGGDLYVSNVTAGKSP